MIRERTQYSLRLFGDDGKQDASRAIWSAPLGKRIIEPRQQSAA
jgi:hypothetical protein